MLCRILLGLFCTIFLLELTTAQLGTHKCNSVSFPCMDANNEPRCIPQAWICDGYTDCYDNMDEANCYYTGGYKLITLTYLRLIYTKMIP